MRDMIICFKCSRLNIIRTKGLVDDFVFACNVKSLKIMEPSANIKIFEARNIPHNCKHKQEHKFYIDRMSKEKDII